MDFFNNYVIVIECEYYVVKTTNTCGYYISAVGRARIVLH